MTTEVISMKKNWWSAIGLSLAACGAPGPGSESEGESTSAIPRSGRGGGAGNSGWGLEIALDLDMVSAACPNCRILLVEASSASIVNLGTAVNTAASLGAVAISNSYGGSEYAGETNDEQSYYNHPGVMVTVS